MDKDMKAQLGPNGRLMQHMYLQMSQSPHDLTKRLSTMVLNFSSQDRCIESWQMISKVFWEKLTEWKSKESKNLWKYTQLILKLTSWRERPIPIKIWIFGKTKINSSKEWRIFKKINKKWSNKSNIKTSLQLTFSTRMATWNSFVKTQIEDKGRFLTRFTKRVINTTDLETGWKLSRSSTNV